MNVKVYTQYYDDVGKVSRKLESLYKEDSDNLVSWNISEYLNQYAIKLYRLWWVIKEKDIPTNID